MASRKTSSCYSLPSALHPTKTARGGGGGGEKGCLGWLMTVLLQPSTIDLLVWMVVIEGIDFKAGPDLYSALVKGSEIRKGN